MGALRDIANGKESLSTTPADVQQAISRTFGRRARTSAGVEVYMRQTIRAIQLGEHALASGDLSTSLGPLSVAAENESMAIGAEANVLGHYSVGIGNKAQVRGRRSLQVGADGIVHAVESISVGTGNRVVHDNCVAIGTDIITTAAHQIRIGAAGDAIMIGGAVGVNFSGPITNLTIVNGIITAAS